MKTKHTPGPWYAEKIVDRAEFNIFPAGGTYAIVTVKPPEFDALHSHAKAIEANACLIAAAPELLAALRALLEDAIDLGIYEGNMSGSAVAARNAIDKATGGAA